VFDINNSTSQSYLVSILANSIFDLSSCLVNCSNNGICIFDPVTQKYVCKCFVYFSGTSCQVNAQVCSAYPCLNSGTCISLNNDTLFTCECPSMYYGVNCEKTINICQNKSCSNNGYCTLTKNLNSSLPVCKCYNGFYGVDCELVKLTTKIQHGIQWFSIILCALCIGFTICLIISNDAWNLFILQQEPYQRKKHIKCDHNHFHYYTHRQSSEQITNLWFYELFDFLLFYELNDLKSNGDILGMIDKRIGRGKICILKFYTISKVEDRSTLGHFIC